MTGDEHDDDGVQARAVKALKDLYRQLENALDEAGDNITRLVEEADIKQRLSDAIDAIDDVRLELLRRIRGEEASADLAEMTVKELRELARKRDIAGRSGMNKAELIEALSDD